MSGSDRANPCKKRNTDRCAHKTVCEHRCSGSFLCSLSSHLSRINVTNFVMATTIATCLPANHRSGCLLANLFRFYSQRELTGEGIEDFRVPERPRVINRHFLEAPF